MVAPVTLRSAIAAAVLSAACASSGPAPQSIDPAEPDVPDDEYAMMGVAASSRIKTIANDRIVGMYQTDSPSKPLRGVIEASIETYGFREVHLGGGQVVCAPRVRSVRASVTSSVQSCGFAAPAEVLVQITSIQIFRDTGYVGGLFSEVARGSDKVLTTPICILAARHGKAWIGVRHGIVPSARDCASDRKH